MSRSRTGCWTCRRRKKKCDENHPTCFQCSRLGLFCEGYGRRPQDLTHRFTKITRDLDATQRELSSPSNFYAGQRQEEDRQKGKEAERSLEYYLGVWRLPKKPRPYNPHQFLRLVPGTSSKTTIAASASIPPYVPLPPPFPSAGFSCFSTKASSVPYLLSTYFSRVFTIIAYFYTPPAPDLGHYWMCALFPQSPSLYYSCLALGECYELFVKKGTEFEWSPSELFREFYALAVGELKERVGALGKVSKVGKPRRKPIKENNEQEIHVTENEDEELSSPIKAVDLLASIWQLLTIEVWKSVGGHWEMHWIGMDRVLCVMGTIRIRNELERRLPEISSLSTPAFSGFQTQAASRMWSSEAAALRYHVECFIWMDVLASSICPDLHSEDETTGRCSNRITFDYISLLREGQVQMSTHMGCENWVMLTIKEISLLHDRQKLFRLQAATTRMSAVGQALDMKNMGSKEAISVLSGFKVLQSRLSSRLDALLKARTAAFARESDYSNFTKPKIEFDRSFVTEAYIRSAIVLCHVYSHQWNISARLQLQTNVDFKVHLHNLILSSLHFFQHTAPKHLLIRMAWAYGVTASMAEDEQEQQAFRGILHSVRKNGYLVGCAWKSLLLAEQCWQLRRERREAANEDYMVTWEDGMKRLGVRLLLI